MEQKYYRLLKINMYVMYMCILVSVWFVYYMIHLDLYTTNTNLATLQDNIELQVSEQCGQEIYNLRNK